MKLQKLELEVMAEALEWALATYRVAMINSPEATPDLMQRRTAARKLIDQVNKAREQLAAPPKVPPHIRAGVPPVLLESFDLLIALV